MSCILKDAGRRWEGPIIPFTIDANLTNPQRVLHAIAAWETVTGIRFVVRDDQEDYIRFRHGQGACHSDAGRFTSRMSNRDGSTTSISSALRTCSRARITIFNIMHYGQTAFSRDPVGPPPLLTIEGNQGEVLDGSTAPTSLDAQFVNQSYRFQVGIVRRSDSGVEAAGAVGGVAITTTSPGTVVTAVRTDAGNLKLIQWMVNPVGGITRGLDSGDQAGEASHIAIAAGQRIVTAVRTGSGRLKLISWDFVAGELKRIGDSANQAGEASLIQILALGPNFLVTACRTGDGHLLLITWALNQDGTFTRLSDSGGQAGQVGEAGQLGEVSLTLVRPRLGGAVPAALVATTVIAANGHAKVILWRLTPAHGPGAIARTADSGNQIGKASLIASTTTPTRHLVVSCRAGGGSLELIAFAVSGAGDTLVRVADSGSQAGEIRLNALIARPQGAVSAVRAGSGRLKLIGWRIDADGTITRAGDSSDQAGEVSAIVLGSVSQPNAALVTGVRRGDGALALISWDDNPSHGEV